LSLDPITLTSLARRLCHFPRTCEVLHLAR